MIEYIIIALLLVSLAIQIKLLVNSLKRRKVAIKWAKENKNKKLKK